MKKILLTSTFLFSFFTLLFAQQRVLNREWFMVMENDMSVINDTLSKYNSNWTHTNFRPLKELGEFSRMRLAWANRGALRTFRYGNGPWLYRKIKNENLFIINDTSDKFYLTIDPLFQF